jgi:hypothetical protein
VTVHAPLSLNDWFNSEIRPMLCLLPVSTSPKPVHALSNFFDRCLSISQTRPTAELARLCATKESLWAVPHDELRRQSSFALPSENPDLDRLRHAVAGALASDRAVYKGTYSFQICHLGLVHNDRTDGLLGELGAALVMSSPHGVELMEECRVRLGQRQGNPAWEIADVFVPVPPAAISVVGPLAPPPWATEPECVDLAGHLRAVLLRSLELVVRGRDAQLGLRVLATSLTWVGAMVYAQVPALLSGQPLQPLLVEAGEPGQFPGLRDASASTRRALNGAWETWLTERLHASLEELFAGSEPKRGELIKWLEGSTGYGIKAGRKINVGDVFTTWAHEPTSDLRAAAHTLQDLLGASMDNKPSKWFDAVGRHCGFIGPRRGHPARFRAEVPLIPTMILAGLDEEPSEYMPLDVWLENLHTRFGILFGPHQATRAMTDRAPEPELEANRDELSKLLAAAGLAHRFSDGVTEVLDLRHVWRMS